MVMVRLLYVFSLLSLNLKCHAEHVSGSYLQFAMRRVHEIDAPLKNDPQHLSGLVRRILYQFIGPN